MNETIMVVMISWLAAATIGFSVLEGASFLDSVYLTVITLSTVGYEQPEWVHNGGKIWAILVIVFGIAAVAIEVMIRHTITAPQRFFFRMFMAPPRRGLHR